MSDPRPENTLDALPVFTGHHGRPELWPGLSIEGLVQTPTRLTDADLAALTQQSLTDDFQCLEGWSAPDQQWEGVPLSVLLNIAGPLPNARYAAISAADFSITIPLDADVSNVLLATRLNGATLEPDHGGPCRLAMVERACYSSVKWVDTIRLAEEMPVATARDIAAARNAARETTTP